MLTLSISVCILSMGLLTITIILSHHIRNLYRKYDLLSDSIVKLIDSTNKSFEALKLSLELLIVNSHRDIDSYQLTDTEDVEL